MVPERGRVMPMIERTVVVLPMPLRPSRLTTCDAGTSSEMPNRTWLRPYAVCRSRTASIAPHHASSPRYALRTSWFILIFSGTSVAMTLP